MPISSADTGKALKQLGTHTVTRVHGGWSQLLPDSEQGLVLALWSLELSF